MTKISVIIPTFNEETYLPKLLERLSRQTFKDFEIIVADAHSKDNTRDIAREYGAQVVDGGMPAVGRNRGAAAATGDILLFLDADVKVSRTFLSKAYKEMLRREIDVATCEAKPLSNLALDQFMLSFANLFVKLSQFTAPHAPGYCIFLKKEIFEKIHGFNEELKLAEDHDLVHRASQLSPMRVLRDVSVLVSVRRFKKEGRLDYIKKSVQITLHRALNGEIKDDVFEYSFGDFEKQDSGSLRELERKINKLNRNYNTLTKRFSIESLASESSTFRRDFEKRMNDIESALKKSLDRIRST